jgi:cyclopropane fatty-acyl-phospholipid synthase-like methyltransferase
VERDPARYLGLLRNAFEKHYGERSDVWTEDREMRAFPSILHGRLKLPSTARVLDLGCGAGRDVEYFAALYASVEGIDLYAHADWAEIEARCPNARFWCVDVLGHAWETGYDLVFDNGCFHHQHPEHYGVYLDRVREMVAGRGGSYVLSTFKNEALEERIDDNGRLHRYFSDADLHRVIEAAGLRVFDELDAFRVRHRDFYRLTFCHAA